MYIVQKVQNKGIIIMESCFLNDMNKVFFIGIEVQPNTKVVITKRSLFRESTN